ncbi:MAG TPA: hypothetical protein VGM53_01200 [Streptosporangiaceae bacterium]
MLWATSTCPLPVPPAAGTEGAVLGGGGEVASGVAGAVDGAAGAVDDAAGLVDGVALPAAALGWGWAWWRVSTRADAVPPPTKATAIRTTRASRSG